MGNLMFRDLHDDVRAIRTNLTGDRPASHAHRRFTERAAVASVVLAALAILIAAVTLALQIVGNHTAPPAGSGESTVPADRSTAPLSSAVAQAQARQPATAAYVAAAPTPVSAIPAAFTGPPGSIVCISARVFAPEICRNVAPNRVSGLQADWSQPVYVCGYGENHANDLCNCRVCKRIPY